jgi:CDP-glucose 4,6-dehydratase
MPLNRSFWNGRRVFLTGHTGFKGSWLSLWLSRMGADVVGYALDPPTQPTLFEQADVASTMRSIRGDIRDLSALQSAIEDFRPEVLIHLAAQSVVRRGYEDPVENYSTNVMGTVNVFEALRQLKRPCVVVNVTSDKCYENQEWIWGYRENERMGGRDPYSNSKACAELVTSSYRDSFFSADLIQEHGIALGSVRAGNAIGGGDWTRDQLIPDLIRAFVKREPCVIRNPQAYRPWQFVLEPLRGYLMLAEQLAEKGEKFASGWNFGPSDGDAKPVSWIADKLARSWGDGASWVLDGAIQHHEARSLKLDASKAAVCLGWHPLLPLDLALDWIVEWYRAFQRGEDLRELTLKQIAKYEELAARQQ